MKKIILCFLLLSSHIFYAQQGWWTWMNGSKTSNDPGNFGSIGIPASANNPPALYEAGEWTDLQGNFWMYGGLAPTGPGNEQAVLWKYDPVAGVWTWINGSNTLSSPGVYGTQGIPSPVNHPGARAWGMTTWIDLSGDLWLFGGEGYDASGGFGPLNDLWKYSIALNEWTWMNGSDTHGDPGNYGTAGTTLSTNLPPSRYECAASWTDNAGKLWLFGGLSFSPSIGNLNDLWEYDPAVQMWTWIRGANTVNATGSYGTQGIPSSTNDPPAREAYAKWKDNAGNLWLWGGTDLNLNTYNDLWKYSSSTNEWTWMRGSPTANSNGAGIPECIMDSLSDPGSKGETRAAWTDNCGNFWLYGGGRGGSFDTLWSDLWYYKVSTNTWARVAGTGIANDTGSWGIQGTPAPVNRPSARAGSIPFQDKNGNLWLFGGSGHWFNGYNDLWKFTPDTFCTAGSCAPLRLDIKETEIISGMTLYPNPASDQVIITYTGKQMDCRFDLIDMTGRILMTRQSNSGKEIFNLSGIESGCYFGRVTPRNHAVLVRKFIKN